MMKRLIQEKNCPDIELPAFWNPLDIQYYLIINPLIYVHIRIQYICHIWTQYLVEGKFKDQKYPICKNKNKM